MAAAWLSEEGLQYTPTWVVAVVCTIIVAISLFVERFLHYLGKILKHNHQDALYEALQKLKEELMLLGFISLLLTVFQHSINHICVEKSLSSHLLPCKEQRNIERENYKRFSVGYMEGEQRLLSENAEPFTCSHQGKVSLLSEEALHQLHIFIFVLAVVHAIFSAITMVLGGAKTMETVGERDQERTIEAREVTWIAP